MSNTVPAKHANLKKTKHRIIISPLSIKELNEPELVFTYSRMTFNITPHTGHGKGTWYGKSWLIMATFLQIYGLKALSH